MPSPPRRLAPVSLGRRFQESASLVEIFSPCPCSPRWPRRALARKSAQLIQHCLFEIDVARKHSHSPVALAHAKHTSNCALQTCACASFGPFSVTSSSPLLAAAHGRSGLST